MGLHSEAKDLSGLTTNIRSEQLALEVYIVVKPVHGFEDVVQ